MAEIHNKPPGKRRGNPAMAKGAPSLNPGGRPKKLVEIEKMLDAEHRTPENMRDVFKRLKALALGEVVSVLIPGAEGETRLELKADPAFMKLYLERTLGPVKDLAVDLADAPDGVLRWVAENLGQQAN